MDQGDQAQAGQGSRPTETGEFEGRGGVGEKAEERGGHGGMEEGAKDEGRRGKAADGEICCGEPEGEVHQGGGEHGARPHQSCTVAQRCSPWRPRAAASEEKCQEK